MLSGSEEGIALHVRISFSVHRSSSLHSISGIGKDQFSTNAHTVTVHCDGEKAKNVVKLGEMLSGSDEVISLQRRP